MGRGCERVNRELCLQTYVGLLQCGSFTGYQSFSFASDYLYRFITPVFLRVHVCHAALFAEFSEAAFYGAL